MTKPSECLPCWCATFPGKPPTRYCPLHRYGPPVDAPWERVVAERDRAVEVLKRAQHQLRYGHVELVEQLRDDINAFLADLEKEPDDDDS